MPGCRSCSCPSAPSGPRPSSGPGGRCATARTCRRRGGDAAVSLDAPARVLVVGGGGREHALAWKLAHEPATEAVVVAPGSAGSDAEPGVRAMAVDPMDPE